MFKLTGRFDEFSARIPSVIAGTLGVLVTYFWANAMFSARVGCFAGIILATSFLYSGMARTADVDMILPCLRPLRSILYAGGISTTDCRQF